MLFSLGPRTKKKGGGKGPDHKENNILTTQNHMFGLGMPEIVIIVVVLGILFFGSNKITELAKSAGRLSGEYKKGKAEIEGELNKIKADFKSEEVKANVDSHPEKIS